MNILWSFNKQDREADHWEREIRAASTPAVTFVPFNHGRHIDIRRIMDAWHLDAAYRNDSAGIRAVQSAVAAAIRDHRITAMCVTNCPPYHPDFLRTLPVYKVLYSTDDPEATYKRTIPYLHAYDHVLFCAPGYSRDMEMQTKMRDAGMTNADWLPLGAFDFEGAAPDDEMSTLVRDIDIVYVGAFWRQKIDTLMAVSRAFGSRFVMRGQFLARHNAYINLRYGAARWVGPVSLEERVGLYRRAKIGINLHWNQFGLGNQRLYHLPANGVMQICDCPAYAHRVFAPDEIATFSTPGELIDRIRWYLDRDAERVAVARRAHERVMREYRIGTVLQRAAALIGRGMERRPARAMVAASTEQPA